MDTAFSLPRPDPRWALFLDVDGTIVEIAPVPDAVTVGRPLVALLDALATALGGAVALVSGRPIAALDELFAPLRLPAAGNHGLERRDAAGRVFRPGVDAAALDPAREEIERFADRAAGVVVEDKTLSIALHYRLVPEIADRANAFVADLAARLGPGFRVQRGKMLVELRPVDGDKGSVVDAFMTEPPFAGRRPVFVGDDVTDEDGFAVVNRLGGHTIRVGANGPTVARWRVDDVDALRAWLARLAQEQPVDT